MNPSNTHPPRFGTWLFEHLLPIEDGWAVLGDLEEEFYERVEAFGVRAARRWYRRQVIKSTPLFVHQAFYWGTLMFKNYLLVAFRNLTKHKGYSFINITGLATGLACFTLILLYIQDELAYDRFHENADRIYRVLDIRKVDGVGEESSSAPFPLAAAMENDYPSVVEHAVRFFNFQSPTLTLAYHTDSGEARQFNETKVFFTDSMVFKVFDFPLQQGNAQTALAEPNTIVLTEAMATKYFGTADPIGKTLRFEDQHDFRVTGVLANLPKTMHFEIDFLASMASLSNPDILREGLLETWTWNPCWTYVLLAEGANPDVLEADLPNFVYKNFSESRRDFVTLQLQPLTDIHLHSRYDYEIRPNSDITYVYLFSVIAAFILLIACINFTNLSTARSAQRAREVGMRKVLGAHRGQLIKQFLGESLLSTGLALLVAIPLILAALPLLNNLANKALVFDISTNTLLLLILAGITLAVGLVSGLYPALFLSGFRPAGVLKGTIGPRSLGGTRLRKALVVTQFTISIALIIGTLVARQQLTYLREARLGFDQDQVIFIQALRSSLYPQYDTFKQELLQNPNIRSVTISEDVPGSKHQTGRYLPEGSTDQQQFPRLMVLPDFVETFGMEVVAGRAFSEDFPTDFGEGIIINEAMVRHLGWGDPSNAIGKPFNRNGRPVLGVVKDFNYTSLHQPIGPFVLQCLSDNLRSQAFFGRYVAIRLAPNDLTGTLAFLEATWDRFVPDRSFDFFFHDQALAQLYQAEDSLKRVTQIFALLAVAIACLGLFGLASFTAEQRTKEIGIRKVLGAPVNQLILMLAKEFVLLVGIATLIAWPLAYVALSGWLNNFAYQIGIGLAPFVVAGLLALLIATLTVSYQAIKAALSDPVKALRYE